MRTILLIIFTALMLLPVSSWSDNSAVDGLALMKIEHGARAAGMGGAFGSMGIDANVSAYNPAGVVGVEKFTVSFGHTVYWDNIRLESGYFAKNLSPRWYLLGGVRYGAVDDLEYRVTPTTLPEELFQSHDISVKTGVAYRLTERVNAGVAMGWYIQKIEAWRGSAFNVDLGIQAKLQDNLSVGAAVTSLGGDFNLTKPGQVGSRDISLPTTYRIGGSYQYQKYLGAADIVILDDEFHVNLGAEARLHEMFHLRSGYMVNYDTKNFTAGASFFYRKIIVDYAFVPYTSNLGTSHLFNLTFSI